MDKLENKIEKQRLINKFELTKYNIYLKVNRMDSLIDSVHKNLYHSDVSFRKPSLEPHITLLGFYSDSDEIEMFEKLKKYAYERNVTTESFDILGKSYSKESSEGNRDDFEEVAGQESKEF